MVRNAVFLVVASVFMVIAACKKKQPQQPQEPAEPKLSVKAKREPVRRGPRRARRTPGDRVCRLMKPCYQKYRAFGRVMGRLNVKIDAQGKGTGAAFSRGKAPAPVKRCLANAGRQIYIQGYKGPAGIAWCEWGGTLMQSGIEMMSWSSGFVAMKSGVAADGKGRTPREPTAPKK